MSSHSLNTHTNPNVLIIIKKIMKWQLAAFVLFLQHISLFTAYLSLSDICTNINT